MLLNDIETPSTFIFRPNLRLGETFRFDSKWAGIAQSDNNFAPYCRNVAAVEHAEVYFDAFWCALTNGFQNWEFVVERSSKRGCKHRKWLLKFRFCIVQFCFYIGELA